MGRESSKLEAGCRAVFSLNLCFHCMTFRLHDLKTCSAACELLAGLFSALSIMPRSPGLKKNLCPALCKY